MRQFLAKWLAVTAFSATLLPLRARPARAAAPTAAAAPAPAAPRAVLDIEKLRAVTAGKYPNEIPTCDVLVVGGGLGGVAAAEALARQWKSVILVEPTSMLGGQLTTQGVAVPDENSYIEREGGPGTRSYRELREQVRARYRAMPGIRPGKETNVGQCWVSRVSGEPAVWEAAIRARLEALRGMGGVKRVLTRTQLVAVRRFDHSGRAHYADFVDLDTGRVTRIAAQYLLDATEMGDGLRLAGSPWTVGAECRDEHGEPDAPEHAHPEWIQSFTYCFAVRWVADRRIVERPAEYDALKSLGEYTLAYDYSDARGRVYYKMLAKAPGAGGPFWTYRRLVAAASFAGNPRRSSDIVLINWRGNDFHEENPIGRPLEEQIRILKRGKAFAQGFLYWLQTECPRDDGGFGYPEIQLAPEVMGSDDGFSIHPYIRESRRLLAEFTLTERHLLGDGGVQATTDDRRPTTNDQQTAPGSQRSTLNAKGPTPDTRHPTPDTRPQTGEKFFDRVGIALYAMDVHPAKGEPPLLARALPFYLPLGAFIARWGPANVLPAAKNIGATRLALSAARMHPTEWLIGEVAGNLAAFCLDRRVDPTTVRNTPELLAAFQAGLQAAGVPLSWEEVLNTSPGRAAVLPPSGNTGPPAGSAPSASSGPATAP